MKIDRLMAITVYLLNHGRTSAQTLAHRFEVSPRTIMRDMDTLGQSGIPIQSTVGVDGGYEIMDSYVMEKQVASHDDYAFILTALKGLASAYSNSGIEQTLQKMRAIGHGQSKHISVDFSVAHEDEKINAQIRLLEEAIEKRRIVRFHYSNSAGEEKEIQVEPATLQYKWFNWYLIAFSEKHHDYRMFKLVRMDQLHITHSRYTRVHSPSDICTNERSAQDMVAIRLYGKSRAKAKCREYLNGKITNTYENGDFEFCFTVPFAETYWYGVLLSLGSDVRVMEPQCITERIVATCTELIDAYTHVD